MDQEAMDQLDRSVSLKSDDFNELYEEITGQKRKAGEQDGDMHVVVEDGNGDKRPKSAADGIPLNFLDESGLLSGCNVANNPHPCPVLEVSLEQGKDKLGTDARKDGCGDQWIRANDRPTTLNISVQFNGPDGIAHADQVREALQCPQDSSVSIRFHAQLVHADTFSTNHHTVEFTTRGQTAEHIHIITPQGSHKAARSGAAVGCWELATNSILMTNKGGKLCPQSSLTGAPHAHPKGVPYCTTEFVQVGAALNQLSPDMVSLGFRFSTNVTSNNHGKGRGVQFVWRWVHVCA